MSCPVRNVALLLILALAISGRAQAIEVEATGLDGRTMRGRLLQVVPELVLDSPPDQFALTWSEVLALRPLGVEGPADSEPRDAPLRFELSDGSAFGGRIGGTTDGGFTVELPSGQTCRLEAGLLRAMSSTSAGDSALAKLSEVGGEENDGEDVAIIERGQKVMVLRGAVRRIGAEGVLFAWKERELPLPWERLAGLSFARPLPHRSSCTVRLREGDVFSGSVVAGDDTSITLRSPVFDGLVLPWSRIERIECRSRLVTFLSDLVPERYEFTPFFRKQWEYARDRTLTGQPIRLAGREYEKGVTMHSRSSLAYAIGREYHQFAAVVGIADEMASRGDVTLAVLGDGRILWEATNVRGGESPREVLIDVTGVRELSLHVDFGEALDLSDHVCWASARLIR